MVRRERSRKGRGRSIAWVLDCSMWNKGGGEKGVLCNQFRGFTEGLALPLMTKVLPEKFGAETVAPRVKVHRGGQSLEVDVLAYSNGKRNEVFVAEVKSQVTQDSPDQLNEALEAFPRSWAYA